MTKPTKVTKLVKLKEVLAAAKKLVTSTTKAFEGAKVKHAEAKGAAKTKAKSAKTKAKTAMEKAATALPVAQVAYDTEVGNAAEGEKTKLAEAFDKAYPKPEMKLAAIEKAIKGKVVSEARTAVETGGLLAQARHFFQDADKMTFDSKAWLLWAEENFVIRKAQCYNLLKIFTIFDGNELIEGLQTQVLAALTRDPKMLEEAEKKLAKGSLVDAKWVKKYQKEHAPKKLEPKEPKEPKDDKQANMAIDQANEAQELAEGERDKVVGQLSELRAEFEEFKSTHEDGDTPADTGMDKALVKLQHKIVLSVFTNAPAHIALGLKEGSRKTQVTKSLNEFKKVYGEDSPLANSAIIEAAEHAADTMRK